MRQTYGKVSVSPEGFEGAEIEEGGGFGAQAQVAQAHAF
jgi:hypothetical protein